MRGKRHRPEQIARKVQEASAWLDAGVGREEVARRLGVHRATLVRWLEAYAGVEPDHLKRLKALEAENRRLRKLVTDQALDLEMFKELQRGKL